MNLKDRIEEKLKCRFSPVHLEIEDQSYLHRGHEGAKKSGGAHFALLIVAQAFDGQPPVKRHQAVYQSLAEEMNREIHALVIKTLTPEEWSRVSG